MSRPMRGAPVLDRVLAKCEEVGTCWTFTGAASPTGYGFIRHEGRNLYVHRVVYEAMVTEIPEGLQLDHLCRNRSCVNPAHLEPVTPRINTLRGKSIQASNARKTHCPAGHEYSAANTYTSPGRRRSCRTCKSVSDAARYAAKKGRAA